MGRVYQSTQSKGVCNKNKIAEQNLLLMSENDGLPVPPVTPPPVYSLPGNLHNPALTPTSDYVTAQTLPVI